MSISLMNFATLTHNASRMVGYGQSCRTTFSGIGTQKGGPVASIIFKRHPNVYLPANKEQHYFTTHYEQGKAWYEREFADAAPGQIRGEITPYYLFHPKVPERIYRYRANMLLIALLRDPVDRALSQYFHAFRHGFETLSLEDALAAEPERMASGDPYTIRNTAM